MKPDITETKPVRSLFLTKTAVAQYIVALAGVLSIFYPSALKLVQDHATAILFFIPLINLAIRRVTHGRVQLLADSSEL